MTGIGSHVIRDSNGHDPLRHPDPITRLRNVYLASQAPTLREAVLLLIHRLEHIHDGWDRDERLSALAWTAIYETRPPHADELRIEDERGQARLDLDESEAA